MCLVFKTFANEDTVGDDVAAYVVEVRQQIPSSVIKDNNKFFMTKWFSFKNVIKNGNSTSMYIKVGFLL